MCLSSTFYGSELFYVNCHLLETAWKCWNVFVGCSTCQVQEIDNPCITQECQMVYFQTKNPNLGIFRRVLKWKMFCYRLEYFIVLWCILWQVGKISGRLVYYYLFWYVLPRKSGNPGITFAATATSTNVRIFFSCVQMLIWINALLACYPITWDINNVFRDVLWSAHVKHI
jgi:hypothetical protein